jgi:hypothetical protein
MSQLADVWENSFIDFVLRAQTWTISASLNWTLYTAAPGETGGGTIATYGSYADVAVTRSLANFAGTQGAGTTVASSGTGGQSSNNNAITFPAPTSGTNTLTHVAVRDGTTVGIYGALTASRTVNSGDAAPSFAAAAWTLTVA